MSAKIFLAGGTGVLGRRVVPLLTAAGHHVTANTRNPGAAAQIIDAGAASVTVDLFDPAAVSEAVSGHDVVVNLATAIPTGLAAARPKGWALNDRLRTEASANLAAAVPRGGRYVGESITFPYADRGSKWIDESVPRSYSSATESVKATEAAAASAGGGGGVSLRFAMFWADDSAHNRDLLRGVRLGVFPLPGDPDAYTSWVHVDDAAAAVVAAFDAPPGIYNVAEPEPVTRARHAEAAAAALGKSRLRHLPSMLVRLGGPPVEALARSQRISSEALSGATGWEPRTRLLEIWPQMEP